MSFSAIFFLVEIEKENKNRNEQSSANEEENNYIVAFQLAERRAVRPIHS